MTTSNKLADNNNATIKDVSVDVPQSSTDEKLNVTNHIKNSDEALKLTSYLSQSITSLVATEELLSVKREALRSLTSEEIKSVDDERKANREQLESIFRTQLTIEQVVTVCNELLAPLNGGDDAERKRAQRRRNFFRRCLTSAYPRYDSEVTKGRNGGKITVKYVGDEHDRKAVVLVESYRELAKYISDLPQINTKVVSALLRKGEPTEATILDTVPAGLVHGIATGNTSEVLSTIAEKIASMGVTENQANA